MAKPAHVPALGPETPTREAGRLLVRARLGDVRRAEAAAVALDPDGVHDMRVATRRLRAALKVFGRSQHRELDGELRTLQDALGALRDAQVQLAWLESNERHLAARDRVRLRAWFGEPVDELAARARDAIRAWADAIAASVDRAADGVGGRRRLGGKKMHRKLARRTRRIERRIPSVLADPAPKPAHRLRIAAKKARYVAELLEPGFPREIRPLLERLVPLQETLGALHDADVRIERLRRAQEHGSASDRIIAARLVALVVPERERLAAELAAELDAFSASRRSPRAS